MNGNFPNNYIGGWNHIPGSYNYNCPIPLYWPPFNYNYQIPYRNPATYTGNRPFLHQMQPQYVDNRYLPHQMPTYYYDPRHLAHPMPAHYFGPRPLPHQIPEHYVDKGPLPHQNPGDYVDKKSLPHQTSELHADKRNLLHQTTEDMADKRPLSHHKAEEDADNKCLPHPTSEECDADKTNLPQQSSDLPQQTPEPTIPDVAALQRARCEICGVVVPLKNLEAHNNGKKHRRMLIELREQPTESKTSNGEESIHIQKSQKNPVVQLKKVRKSKKVRYLVNNTSHEAPRLEYKEVHAEGSKRKLRDHTGAKDRDFKEENVENETTSFQKKKVPAIKSKRKVRENTVAKDHGSKRETGGAPGGKYMKTSNGIRRSVKNDQPQSTPVELNASARSNISTKAETQCARCDICGVVFPLKSLEAHNNGEKHRRMLIELCEQSTESKTSNGEESVHIQKSQKNPVVQHKKVSKSKKVGCIIKNTSHKAPKYKEVPAEGSKRKCAKDRDFKVLKGNLEMVNNETTSFQKKKVPAVKSKREVRVNTDAKGHGSKRETEEAPGGKYMKTSNGVRKSVKNDKPQSTIVELKASAGSNISAETATVTPEVPMAYQEFTPSPEVESSFEPSGQINSQTEVEECEEHIEVQNCGVETNDQPHSISMEFHGPEGSDINTLIGDTCSYSGAIVLATPQSPIAFEVPTPVAIILTEMSESNVHDEVQNDIVDSNDQQRTISTDSHNPGGSMTNNQTEIVNFDSAAIEIVIEPLSSAWPDAAGTSFEPLTELGLHTETEPEVLEAVAYIESQHPTEGTDIEIDAASEVTVEAETEDGGSQVEVEMDVPAGELGRIHLPQVSVCLTCGDEGFEEAIVYCSKCGDYAMHRYCLKGPVVFTDEVIWFCEDCEEEILDADYPDSKTADSERCEVDSSEKRATFGDPQPIVDSIWRGSLKVFNKSFDKITRLMGHLSTLACPKVPEETRHLPNVLYGDLLQRSAVWPNSFKKFGTNNLSIGLYFFPQNDSFDIVSPLGIKFSASYLDAADFAAKVERYYDQLVDEMISNDLAIRVWVEKAELLIFSSTMLPSQYKRFQSKHYLWGIFKRKQEPFKINDTGS